MIAVLLNPDLLVTYAAAVVVVLLTAVVMTVPPGVLFRTGRHSGKWLDAHEVPENARHAALPQPPITTAADPVATIPDALNVRTA